MSLFGTSTPQLLNLDVIDKARFDKLYYHLTSSSLYFLFRTNLTLLVETDNLTMEVLFNHLLKAGERLEEYEKCAILKKQLDSFIEYKKTKDSSITILDVLLSVKERLQQND